MENVPTYTYSSVKEPLTIPDWYAVQLGLAKGFENIISKNEFKPTDLMKRQCAQLAAVFCKYDLKKVMIDFDHDTNEVCYVVELPEKLVVSVRMELGDSEDDSLVFSIYQDGTLAYMNMDSLSSFAEHVATFLQKLILDKMSNGTREQISSGTYSEIRIQTENRSYDGECRKASSCETYLYTA